MFNKFFKSGFFKISFLIFVFSFFINTNITKANTYCNSSSGNCYAIFILPNDAVLSSYYCDVGIFNGSTQTGCNSLYFEYTFYNVLNQLDSYSEYCAVN